MKKIFLFIILSPLLGLSQTKNVISTNRIFPKTDKLEECNKAIASHAQKYHTGNWKWRVYDILSGPDAGGLMVVEGPNSWTDLDTRGDISAEHTADYAKNVSPLTTDKGDELYGEYKAELSTVQLTEFTNKIAITHVFLKPGYTGDYEALLKKMKKVWEAAGQTVAVYASSSSGPQQYLIVFRYKTGWKERDMSGMKPLPERYEAVNGENTFQNYLEGVRKMVDKSWGEMLEYNADISSK